jgi:hypothetical protein
MPLRNNPPDPATLVSEWKKIPFASLDTLVVDAPFRPKEGDLVIIRDANTKVFAAARLRVSYDDFLAMSQWQRFKRLVRLYRKSDAPDKCIRMTALWDPDDLENDYVQLKGWWKPSNWRYWHWGVDRCQNFERIYLGPVCLLFAV